MKHGVTGFGIDISKTAIKLANDNFQVEKKQNNLPVNFICSDILEVDLGKYKAPDLFFLNSVFHCFGRYPDRQKLYNAIRSNSYTKTVIYMSILLKSPEFEKDKRIFQDENKNLIAKSFYRIFFDFNYLKKNLFKMVF